MELKRRIDELRPGNRIAHWERFPAEKPGEPGDNLTAWYLPPENQGSHCIECGAT
jgi:hypothetical protein